MDSHYLTLIFMTCWFIVSVNTKGSKLNPRDAFQIKGTFRCDNACTFVMQCVNTHKWKTFCLPIQWLRACFPSFTTPWGGLSGSVRQLALCDLSVFLICPHFVPFSTLDCSAAGLTYSYSTTSASFHPPWVALILQQSHWNPQSPLWDIWPSVCKKRNVFTSATLRLKHERLMPCWFHLYYGGFCPVLLHECEITFRVWIIYNIRQ